MGIPVDLMVPESMSDPGGRRGGRLPPHSKRATRRATGLEAAVVDHSPAEIAALEPGDRRSFTIEVAGPAALLVAKLHRLGDRDQDAPERLNDKDAHDVYRLLVAVGTEDLSRTLEMLLGNDLASETAHVALGYLNELFVVLSRWRRSPPTSSERSDAELDPFLEAAYFAYAAQERPTSGKAPPPERRPAIG